MFNIEFKEVSAVLPVIVAILLGVAIIGSNPLNPTRALDIWARYALGALGIVFLGLMSFSWRRGVRRESTGPTDAEYLERLHRTKSQLSDLAPEGALLAEALVGPTKLDVINGSILDSRAEVIVSSDDNYLSARGGVAKAILQKAGPDVAKELSRHRRTPLRQGQLAITTGGDWGCRAIIHPAVIDLDENRYPTREVIATVVRRSLECASALGATSISFPVLGGGTASKHLRPSDSVAAIVSTMVAFLKDQALDDAEFTHAALYIYNRNDASGVPDLPTWSDSPSAPVPSRPDAASSSSAPPGP